MPSTLFLPGHSTQDLLLKLIENVPVFESFNPSELLELLKGSEKRVVKKGEVILKEGDSGRFMYLLIEGEASVSKQGKDVFFTHDLAKLKSEKSTTNYTPGHLRMPSTAAKKFE